MFFGLFGVDKKRVAEMITAARSGNLEKIQQLISAGADINAPEPESGDTPLIAAIDKSQLAAIELLLTHRPNLSLQDKNGNSPLYLSVSRGDAALQMVNLLLEAGANPELGPSQGENAGATPLHIACALGANGCLEALLRHGASSTKQLPSDASPLHTAAIGGDQQTIELLCSAGADVHALTNEGKTPLHNCGITGNAKAAAALIKRGAVVEIPDTEGCTPLMRAVMKNHTEVAKLFLENGANPDVIVRTDGTPLSPLFVAAMDGLDEMIRILLDKGANVAAKVDGMSSPIDVAKHKGHVKAANLISAALKEKKAAIKKETTPAREIASLWEKLAKCVEQQDYESIKKLTASKYFDALEAEARLLIWSVLGDDQKLQALVDIGINTNKTYGDVLTGISPLYAAVGLANNFKVAALLLSAGANPNLEWEDGATPIFEALTNQRSHFLKLLVEKGANVNIKMINGKTPLMLATANNSQTCVDVLLDAGAEINVCLPSNGLGAFGVAIDRLKMDIALHLLSRGAIPEFGSVETLGLAVAEHGSIDLILAIEKAGGSIVRQDQLGRVAFVGSRNKDCEVLDYLFNHGADLSQENNLLYTPLILSVLRGHAKLVKRYAERGDDLNALDIDKETALSLAIEKDNKEMIRILREHHAQVEIYPGLSEEESMLRAAAEGSLGTILNLYDAGVSVNIQNAEGFSPLMLATSGEHLGVVRSLFHIGADINHRNRHGQSATAIATQMGDQNLLATMKEFVADDSVPESLKGLKLGSLHDIGDVMFGRKSHPGKEDIPYDTASDDEDEYEDEEIEVKEPSGVEDEFDESKSNAQEILDKLSQLEDLLSRPKIKSKFEDSMIEKIIEDIQIIKSNGPVEEFARQIAGLLGLLENLLSEPEEEKLPPLLEAASDGDLKEVKRLLKSGFDVNSALPDGTTALIKAVEGEHSSVISELLKSGVDVNLKRTDDISALLLACLVGNEGIVKILAANGANLNETYTLASAQGAVGNNTVLTVAAQRSSLSMCKLLVKLGANVDAMSDIGYTPLAASLANGISEDKAMYFLQQGAKPDLKVEVKGDFLVPTVPLILAASNGFVRVVKELLRLGVDINTRGGDGNTALKMAASSDHAVVINLLIKAGAQVDATDNEGWTALMNVAGNCNLEIAKVIIKAGADVNARSLTDVTPLIQAIGKHEESNLAKSMKHLFGDDDDNEDEDGSNEEAKTIEMIKLLLKHGASPNVDREGTSLLMGAEENDDTELVKLLKKYGASSVPLTNTLSQLAGAFYQEGLQLSGSSIASGESLTLAVGQIDVSRVKELVNQGADINYQDTSGNTPISIAISAMTVDSISRRNLRDLKEIADFLLNRGADLNPKNTELNPLGTAAYLGDVHLVTAMLRHGAQTEALLFGTVTPLLAATSSSHEDCSIALIEADANLETRASTGQTALHLAAGMGLTRVVEACLVRLPELVNTVDENTETPLMLAAKEGYESIVQSLLRFKADATLKNSEGMTAADLARKSGYGELAALLS